MQLVLQYSLPRFRHKAEVHALSPNGPRRYHLLRYRYESLLDHELLVTILCISTRVVHDVALQPMRVLFTSLATISAPSFLSIKDILAVGSDDSENESNLSGMLPYIS